MQFVHNGVSDLKKMKAQVDNHPIKISKSQRSELDKHPIKISKSQRCELDKHPIKISKSQRCVLDKHPIKISKSQDVNWINTQWKYLSHKDVNWINKRLTEKYTISFMNIMFERNDGCVWIIDLIKSDYLGLPWARYKIYKAHRTGHKRGNRPQDIIVNSSVIRRRILPTKGVKV